MVSPGDVIPPPAEPLLTMRGVSKQFGGTQALAGAGIEVGGGEIAFRHQAATFASRSVPPRLLGRACVTVTSSMSPMAAPVSTNTD